MDQAVLELVAGVAVVGVAAQWVAWRLRLPAIIPLLCLGALIGPVLGWLKPSTLLGEVTRPGVGLAVAIIVFEGGLNLNVRELRLAGSGVMRLVAVALPLNWLFGTLVGRYVAGLSLPVALLFGAIIVVTGPTVILPLLRQARLERRPAAFLKWEAIVNDPIGATLTLLVLGFLVLSRQVGPGEALGRLLAHAALGVGVAGVLGGALPFLVRAAFTRDLAPEYLKTPILLAGALGVYAAGEIIQPETGLIGATLFGAVLANIDVVGLQELRRFKESLTVFLVSGVFLVLTANIDPAVLRRLSWPLAATVAAVLFLVRPAAALLASVGARMSWRERVLVGWIGPRGVVAAAVAGLAGEELGRAGYPDAASLLPLVFGVIFATVVLHGATLGPLARALGLASKEPPGLIIVGSSAWSAGLGAALARLGVPILVADPSWEALKPARRAGLRIFHAEVLSPVGEEILDLRDADYLLAASEDDAYNALVCTRFGPELGRERVAQFAPAADAAPADFGREWRGKIILERDLHFARLGELASGGWIFRVEEVVEAGRVPDLPGPDGWPVLAVHAGGQITFFSPEHEVQVGPGDRIIFFIPPPAARRDRSAARRRWRLIRSRDRAALPPVPGAGPVRPEAPAPRPSSA